MKKMGIHIKDITAKPDESGRIRVKAVHKLPAGQKKNAHAKSARLAKAWKGKSK